MTCEHKNIIFVSKKMEIIINEEVISFTGVVKICKDCGLEVDSLKSLNLRTANNIYKKKHNLLLPEDIQNLRRKYNLKQKDLAKIVCVTANYMSGLEQGRCIQSATLDFMLRLLENPKNMEYMCMKKNISFNKKTNSIPTISLLNKNNYKVNYYGFLDSGFKDRKNTPIYDGSILKLCDIKVPQLIATFYKKSNSMPSKLSKLIVKFDTGRFRLNWMDFGFLTPTTVDLADIQKYMNHIEVIGHMLNEKE